MRNYKTVQAKQIIETNNPEYNNKQHQKQ